MSKRQQWFTKQDEDLLIAALTYLREQSSADSCIYDSLKVCRSYTQRRINEMVGRIARPIAEQPPKQGVK